MPLSQPNFLEAAPYLLGNLPRDPPDDNAATIVQSQLTAVAILVNTGK